MMWQYNVIYLSGNDESDLSLLNAAGAEGWEIISVDSRPSILRITEGNTERMVKTIKARLKRRMT